MDLLTLAEAAAELGLSKSTLLTQVGRGRLRAQKLGNQYVLERTEVERYRLESLGQPGRPEAAPEPRRPGQTTKWSAVKAERHAPRDAKALEERGE